MAPQIRSIIIVPPVTVLVCDLIVIVNCFRYNNNLVNNIVNISVTNCVYHDLGEANSCLRQSDSLRENLPPPGHAVSREDWGGETVDWLVQLHCQRRSSNSRVSEEAGRWHSSNYRQKYGLQKVQGKGPYLKIIDYRMSINLVWYLLMMFTFYSAAKINYLLLIKNATRTKIALHSVAFYSVVRSGCAAALIYFPCCSICQFIIHKSTKFCVHIHPHPTTVCNSANSWHHHIISQEQIVQSWLFAGDTGFLK